MATLTNNVSMISRKVTDVVSQDTGIGKISSSWNDRENGTGLDRHPEEIMTALPSKQYTTVNRRKSDPGITKTEIWTRKCRWQISGTAARWWIWQHRAEVDRDQWSVANAPLQATRHKSSKSKLVPYSITELIPVSWQSARRWLSHKPGARLLLLSTRPMVTFPAKDITPPWRYQMILLDNRGTQV